MTAAPAREPAAPPTAVAAMRARFEAFGGQWTGARPCCSR